MFLKQLRMIPKVKLSWASTINYAKADLGKTFNYTVEEVKRN